MQFKELKIGDNFDFISPKIGYNSFFGRCEKTATRKYISERVTYNVGRINCKVYHVEVRDEGYRNEDHNTSLG